MAKSKKFYLKKLLSGSIAMTLSEATVKIVKLLVLPIMTYYLSPEDFGIIASIKMVEGFLIMLFNPGMISGTSRLYYDTDEEEKRKKIIGSSLLFFIFFPLLVVSVVLILGDGFFQSLFSGLSLYPHGIIALALSVIVQPKRLWSSLMSFQFKVGKIALFSVIQLLIEVGVSLLLVVYFLKGVDGRITGIVLGTSFVFIIAIVYLFRYSKGNFSIKQMWKTLIFGLPLAPAIWAYSVLDIADRFLIQNYLGLADLGVYAIAYTIASVPVFLTLGYKKMIAPIFYENMNSGNYQRIESLFKIYIVFYSLVCTSLILFSEELVVIVLNKDFSYAAQIIPWVVLGKFFLGITPVVNAFITYEKKFYKISINMGISAIINIIINVILLPKIGIVGSAIATAISYFVYLSLNLTNSIKLFTKVCSIKIFVLPTLLVGFTMAEIYFLSMNFGSIVIKALTIIIALTSFLMLGYFNKKEKAYMLEIVAKLKNGKK